MGLFGVQLVLSMTMASVLSKLSPHFSFARWLLCRGTLVRYLHPSDEELRKLSGIIPASNNVKGRGRRDRRNAKDVEDKNFTVPRNLNIELDTAPITVIDAIHLQYYTEFQWLMDFSVCALTVYIITEIYNESTRPKAEFNLSLVWIILVILFVLRILYTLTAAYFRSEDTGEMAMCITFGFFFFVLAMVILIIDEDILELQLDQAYDSFSGNASTFLEHQDLESSGPISMISFKLILACMGAVIGAFLTFPGLRFAKMYLDALKYSKDTPMKQVFLHINFLMPFLVTLAWIKPISRDYIQDPSLGKKLTGHKEPILTDEGFELSRMVFILLLCLLRVLLFNTHLQAYLNMAYERIENMKKEAGRISSIDLQRKVARVFYYLCVVSLQYTTPILLLLYTTFLLKTLGGYNSGIFDEFYTGDSSVLSTNQNSITVANSSSTSAESDTTADIATATKQFTLAFAALRNIFTMLFFRGVLSFFCWWLCLTWFVTSMFGIVYYTYFTIS
ncbi:transmembrane protein 161B-like [Saccoglossus kowalevskii]|uniref:Transmembrane protein 161B-like n=1 Tax=Saccoglossus kowalevskii TaxID=10224 RepID=A0ABM0MJA8_SACKO|nr:PREDICTED: transmembrane protein 161B-like [Saccoglossus kowalevskii]